MLRRAPFLRHTLIALILAQPISVAMAQQSPPIPAPRPHVPPSIPRPSAGIILDLSKGATFTFNISPNLPPFTFKMIPDPQDPDQYGNARSRIRDIEVYSGDSGVPSQHLTGCDLKEMEPPLEGQTDPPWFHTEDVNFDGYQDLFLLSMWGATGNQGGCIWLYDPPTGRFEYSKEFSELPRHWIDPSKKTIMTFGRGGMAGAIHTAERYRVEANHLVLVYSQSQDWDNNKKQFHCTVQELHGRSMVTTSDDWGDQAFKECDGSQVALPPSSVKVDGPTEALRLISRVPPVFPPAARRIKGISMTVVLEAVIGKDGGVADLSPLPEDFPLLIQPAIDAVRKWRYEPMLLNDVPVEVQTTITVTFTPD